jgi:hypothetical protein
MVRRTRAKQDCLVIISQGISILFFASDGPQCDFLQAALHNRSLDGSPAGRLEREKARKAEWNPAMTSERKWNNS